MPRCLNCGNLSYFTSSAIPKIVPWNNGPTSGLVAVFNGTEVSHVENWGADYMQIQDACNNPYNFFDSCGCCGSSNILWP
ncbi:hypothetical protein RDV78_09325 [Bacillota bacterium LX-D]|nr:hypothetical protein [Bacillota bacterium LX-D]